ncbi:RNAse P Rpr2/Rpp21 subunit domain-containing protein [Purpureocillium lavendulum]|uniref:RNAse P Rpr2/Rpp21 subunit domain-containing protein n=1 Tax=Purpureocillium lavendulum TaxID=1247861 RepID=A0AB34FXJ9_9HYPO|nr:RNAse P Rpr2/Rpp21 subunit domain-containing protein [Purpureocillium lavendulum]
MAKQKLNPGVQNKIIYTRASYLYQAADYLTRCARTTQQPSDVDVSESKHKHGTHNEKQKRCIQNLSRQAICDMRAVSLKAQIRQGSPLKRTICKFCDTIQVEGDTCHSTIENSSKGGRKPWADVLVMKCITCGNTKRFPVSAPRQQRRTLREAESHETTAEEEKLGGALEGA